MISVAAVLLLAAAQATNAHLASQPATPGYGHPVAVCELEDERIVEASGLIASRRHHDLYYTLNDSGGAAEVYLIDRKGRTRLTIQLDGAANVDWEDIAIGPGENGQFDVCVADIGDNNSKRSSVAIYRFAEPELPAALDSPATQPTDQPRPLRIKARKYEIRYADGPRNAEALAFDSRSGEGFIIEKVTSGDVGIFRLPRDWEPRMTLQRIATLQFPANAPPIERLITGADISPDGRRLAARAYPCGWEWTLPSGDDVPFAKIFSVEPVRLSLAAEPQGESISYSLDNRALLTVSEKRPTVLYESRRE